MIIGHKKQWHFLKKSADSGKLPHALLFSGEEKIGKKFVATELAKFLNCESLKKPCMKCKSCLDIENRTSLDFSILIPEKEEIKIFQIRDLIKKLSLRSNSGSYKIAILDEAHLMNTQAQNCFLKLLEEPKGKTLLILITNYPETLLKTISSRVQKIKFYSIEKAEIEKYFIEKGIEKEKAEKISILSMGKPGLALDFFYNPEKIKERETIISEFKKTINSDFYYRFNYVKKILEENKINLKDLMEIWTIYFRDTLISSLSKDKAKAKKVKNSLELIERTSFLIFTTNINPKFAIENLLINI